MNKKRTEAQAAAKWHNKYGWKQGGTKSRRARLRAMDERSWAKRNGPVIIVQPPLDRQTGAQPIRNSQVSNKERGRR